MELERTSEVMGSSGGLVVAELTESLISSVASCRCDLTICLGKFHRGSQMTLLSAFISALNWRIVDVLNGHKNGE